MWHNNKDRIIAKPHLQNAVVGQDMSRTIIIPLKSADFWAVIALVTWFLVYHLPVTLGQQVFSEGDILWGNLPIRAELTRALADGKLPLWTPLLQAGMPLFAEGHTAALYPLTIIIHLLLPPHLAISYVILFNLCWISIGMYLFARAHGLRVATSLFAGLVFGTSGAITARVSHLDVLTPISWLPWLMFFQVKYWHARYQGKTARHWFVLGCVSLGLQFVAGSPAVIALNLIAFSISGLFASIFYVSGKLERKDFFKPWSSRFSEGLLITLGTILLGAGLGAAQLLPTAELIGWSIRGKELGRSFFTSYSLEPSALSQFFAPFAFFNSPIADNMEFWGYFGVVPLFLALGAPIFNRNLRTGFYAIFAFIALVLALGGSTPFYEWLYYVPVFNRFRVPARFLFLVIFACVFLAATSFDELQNRLRDDGERKNLYLFILLPVMLAIAGSIVLSHNLSMDFWLDVWRWLPIVFVLHSIVLLFTAIPLKITRQFFQIILVGLTCLDLAMFTAPFLSTLARTSPPSELAQVPRTVLAMDHREPVARSLVIKYPSVTQASVRATMWSGLPMAYGRAGILNGYMPFSLALNRNEQYIKDMSLPMRNLMNIRYYLLPLEIAPPEENSPLDDTQPTDGLTLELLRDQPAIHPTRAYRLRLISYTDQTADLPDGFLAGEIDVTLSDNQHRVLPIRLGIETADWAYDGIASIAAINHSKPGESQNFPAYLRSVGRDFTGKKYVAQFDVSMGNEPSIVTAIGIRAFLPNAGLTIEHIDLIDEFGKSVSLSELLRRNDLALTFRSNTAAMWDNRNAMPRAFVVYSANVVDDAEMLDRMKLPDFDPYQTVLLADEQPASLISKLPGKSMVSILEYKPDRVVIQVKTDREGYLVLTDSWYPGWVANIDKIDAPILLADYIFRAVRIQPGDHLVEFEYKPLSFFVGVLSSALSLVALCTLTILAPKFQILSN